MTRQSESYKPILLGLISPLALLSLWELAGARNWVNPILLPRPSQIIDTLGKSALVPVLFLFLGIGKVTMITIVVLAVVFPVLISTLQGVRGLDPVLLETARTFQVSRLRMIVSVVLPASLPMILAGMRVGLGLGLVLVILAEMLAGETGLGFQILDLQRSFHIRDMFAWIFILVALGGSLTILFNGMEKRLIPWRGKA